MAGEDARGLRLVESGAAAPHSKTRRESECRGPRTRRIAVVCESGQRRLWTAWMRNSDGV